MYRYWNISVFSYRYKPNPSICCNTYSQQYCVCSLSLVSFDHAVWHKGIVYAIKSSLVIYWTRGWAYSAAQLTFPIERRRLQNNINIATWATDTPNVSMDSFEFVLSLASNGFSYQNKQILIIIVITIVNSWPCLRATQMNMFSSACSAKSLINPGLLGQIKSFSHHISTLTHSSINPVVTNGNFTTTSTQMGGPSFSSPINRHGRFLTMSITKQV